MDKNILINIHPFVWEQRFCIVKIMSGCNEQWQDKHQATWKIAVKTAKATFINLKGAASQ
jgi:hypothetical protein